MDAGCGRWQAQSPRWCRRRQGCGLLGLTGDGGRVFGAVVSDGAPTLTPPIDAPANMRLIDAIYRAAGAVTPRLRPKGRTHRQKRGV
jgi:hypothetical protein